MSLPSAKTISRVEKLRAEDIILCSSNKKEMTPSAVEKTSTILNMIDTDHMVKVEEIMDSIGFKASRLEKVNKSKELLEESWANYMNHLLHLSTTPLIYIR